MSAAKDRAAVAHGREGVRGHMLRVGPRTSGDGREGGAAMTASWRWNPTITRLRWWTHRQWGTTAVVGASAFVLIGDVGQRAEGTCRVDPGSGR